MFKLHNFLVIFLFLIHPLYADYTADVMLTDFEWNDIGNEYPALTEEVYVEVYDPDESGSIEVEFTSNSDEDSETVVLDEVSEGLFRGSIPIDFLGFELLSDDEEARLMPGKLNELKVLHPDWNDRKLKSKARYELVQEAIKRHESGEMDEGSGSRDDGLLQVRTGDVIEVSYLDVLNDFGNQENITDIAVYGGWTGEISGHWSIENSPYVLTGDVYVSENQELHIDAGVEVLFFDSYQFHIYGSLFAQGSPEDSIVFRPLNDNPWRMEVSYGWWSETDGLNLVFDHVHFNNGEQFELYAEGYDWGTSFSINITNSSLDFMDSYFNIQAEENGGEFYFDNNTVLSTNEDNGQGPTVEFYNNTGNTWSISNSTFSGFGETGLHVENHGSGNLNLDNCTFTDNEIGLFVRGNILLENSTIADNYYGVVVLNTEPIINYNDIYNNMDYDAYTETGGDEVDLQFNYWGEATTEEMNEGGNPKNIEKIYDYFDDNGHAMINYSGWLESEVSNLLGDLNGDASIDVLDIVIIVNYIVESGGLYYDEQGDMNGDGMMNIQDLIIIIFDFILEN